MRSLRFNALGATGAVSGLELGEHPLTVPAPSPKKRLRRPLPESPASTGEKKSVLHFELTTKKVKRKDLMHFCRQLSVFVRAGIPIIDGLELIAGETAEARLKSVITDMAEALRAGETFAGAAAAHREAFAPYHLGMLQSAELTGNLDIVLERIAQYIDRDLEAKNRIVGSLIYPALVFLMAIITVLVMSIFVLPRFETFFNSFHATLPLPTRMLISLCAFMSSTWMLFLGVGAGVALLTFLAWRSKRGRTALDLFVLKLPVLGDLVQHAILERICRILSSMLGAGVALPEAVSVSSSATSNTIYQAGLTGVRDRMMEGEGLAAPLAATGLFKGAAQQIFRVGEETGTLEEQLETAASFYDRELEYRIKRFTTLFEPAVIVVVGLIVGFVAVALISAMYGIYRQVKV